MPANSVTLFEEISRRTWGRLRAAHDCNISMGETTFTDTNLLDMRIARLPNVRVYKAVGRDEPEKGFDWEWWIGRYNVGWWRYSVQAKKLDLKKGTYSDLRHPVGEMFQIDILDDFARAQRSIPLYCFYNHVSAADATAHWNCPLNVEPEQLGCSVVPLNVVRGYHDNRVRKSFGNLHAGNLSLPWRCLVRCPELQARAIEIGNQIPHPLAMNRDVAPILELPPFLLPQDDAEEAAFPIRGNSYYESDLRGYPQRVMVVDLSDEAIR